MSRRLKEITLGEYTFVIEQFTPQVACFWAFRLLGSLGGSMLFGDISQTISQFIGMQRTDFAMLMSDSLNAVKIKMPSGLQPFYDQYGGFAVLDPDSPIVFEIMTEAFTYSLSPFLNKEMIARMKASIAAYFPKATGPETSSSDQSKPDSGSTMTSGMVNTPSQTSSTF